MSDKVKECSEYLKSRKEYRRIMEYILKNFIKYGGPSGNVVLKDASFNECMAASEIIAPRRAYTPPLLKFKISDFESGFEKTRFGGISLRKLLEEYFQTEIVSNRELKESEESERIMFWKALSEKCSGSVCSMWVSEMIKTQSYGYRTVMAELKKPEKTTENMLHNIFRAIQACTENNSYIQLAVLSAEITGNPHYFDKSETAGRLLLSCMSFISGKELTGRSETEKEIYDFFRIEPDTISGAAAVLGLRLYEENNAEHPAYRYFADRGEMCLISVASLNSVSGACCDKKRAFIVENPMVFSALSGVASKTGECLICTFGQIKYSGLKIIDMLADSGCRIYYSGDFDPEGLQIADKLISRNSGIIPWRMSAEDYRKLDKTETISEKRMKILESISNSVLVETAAEMKKSGKSAYQELQIKVLSDDIAGGV